MCFIEKEKRLGLREIEMFGVTRAKGEWIVFIDDDCIAQKGHLVAYSKAIEQNPKVDLFEGYIFPDRPKRTWAETCLKTHLEECFGRAICV